MNVDRKTPVVLLSLTMLLLLLMSSMVFATGTYSSPEKDAYARQIAERALRGESITTTEKQMAYPIIEQMIRARNPNAFLPRTPTTDAFGGPDSAGYRWMDDREANGPTYSWIDLSNSGTGGPIGDDVTTAAVPLGFSFPYYGHTYTNCYISVNGFISFSSTYASNTSSAWYTNTALPNATAGLYGTPVDAIFAWWDDLSSTANAIKYISSDTAFVCSWISPTLLGGTTPLSFQMILYPSGLIKLQYAAAPATEATYCTVGCQNSTGTVGLQITYAANPNNLLAVNRAIIIYTLGAPEGPNPSDGLTGVPTNTVLRWRQTTSAASYDVYFDTENPPVASVSTQQTDTSYSPTLSANTTYYWKVVAYNNGGTQSNAGPVWSFTTGGGTAPNAPSAGSITGNTSSALTIGWTDNSNNETGFPISRLSGTTYTALATAAANATSHVDNNLTPNTHYFYRIFSQNATATSVDFAEANGWTLANVPGTPTVVSTGITSIALGLTPSTPANPDYTLYSIHCTTNDNFVQTNGTMAATEAWATMAAWGASIPVRGLTAGQSYSFQVRAKNGENILTAYSGSVVAMTSSAFSMPFSENFSAGTTFPPADWQVVQQPVIGNTWAYFATGNGNAGSAYIYFWSDANRNSKDFLWSPPISTVGYSGISVAFDRSYYGGYTATYSDTLEIVYSFDGGVTYSSAFYWAGRGTAEHALPTGTTGGSTTPGTWVRADIPLPAEVENHPSVLIGFLGRTDYGPNLYLDNITIAGLHRPPANPAPPDGATNVPLNATLMWDLIPGATGYNVNFDTETPPTALVSENQIGNAYTPTQLTAGTTYYWQVTALYGTISNPGPVWSFTAGNGVAPNAPTAATITDNATTSLTIHWTDNSNNESGFPVYRFDGTAFTMIGTAAANATSYTDNNLTPSSQYFYRVFSQNANATSVAFADVNGWTNPVAASAPTVALVGQGYYTMAITSLPTDQNGTTTRYKIQELNTTQWVTGSNTLGGTPRLTTRLGWTNYAISGLTSGATYRFAAVAVNGADVEAAAGPAASITTADINHGGPDSYGYRYITSNAQTGGPTHSWITPSANATLVSTWTSTDDGQAGPFPIGFTFPFYERTYTTFYAGSNGRIQFGAANAYNYTSTVFPMATYPAGIYFWNYDMSVVSPTVVSYEVLTNPNRLLINYSALHTLGSTAATVDAQVVLCEDGTFYVVYGAIAATTTFSAAAIQDSNGTRGIQYGPPIPAQNTTYMFYRLGQPSNPLPENASTNIPTNTALTWDPCVAAISYDVKFDTENPPVAQVATHQVGTTYTPTLSANTTYYWQVTANADTTGSLVNSGPVWSFTTAAGAAPAAPSAGVITAPTTGSLTFGWTDNSNNETGFAIKRSVDGITYTDLATVGVNITSYTDNALTPGTQYWYRAFSQNGTISSVNFANATGWTTPVMAGAPTLALSGQGFYTVSITGLGLDNNGSNTRYKLTEISTTPARWVTATGTLDTTNARSVTRPGWTNYVVSGLTSGATYHFAVVAVNGEGVAAAVGPEASITTADINHGGPDSYGYRYITSNAQTGGPTHSWITPSETAATVSTWTSTDDGSAGPFPIGFSFPFYGRDYTTFYAGTNGRIQFGAANAYNYTSPTFPLATYPAGIYFWNYDMSVVSPTVVKYETLTNPNRLLISYSALHTLGSTAATVDAQVVLCENGTFYVVYGPIATGTTFAAAAIQDSNGTRGIQYGPPVPAQNTTYMFYTLGQASNPSPADGATNQPQNITLRWAAAAAATTYDVRVSTTTPPEETLATDITATSFTIGSNFAANTQYYWQVIAHNGATSNPGPIWSFTTGTGLAPVSPDSLLAGTITISSIQLRWHDRSTTETGFSITRSLVDSAYATVGTAAANAQTWTDNDLSVNTHYYYHVAAAAGTVISTDYATLDTWTLASVPAVPTVTTIGITSATITINNNETNPNPAYTEYAIAVNDQYVQLNGFLGADPVWRTLTQWGTPSFSGLAPTSDDSVRIVARNGANVETAFSGAATFTTQGAFSLPFSQDFEQPLFPPADWTRVNADNLTTWSRYSSGGVNSALLTFSNYTPASGQIDELWTPPFVTTGATIVKVTFDWYYFNRTYTTPDTLDVVYSLDGMTTRSLVWSRNGNTTDTTRNLRVVPGTGGTATVPPAAVANWGHGEIWMPGEAVGQASVQLGFISHNRGGPYLFVDNVMVEAPTVVPLNGIVHRLNDDPVEGAEINIHNGAWTTTTDADGIWNLLVPSGSYNITIQKPCMYPIISYVNYEISGTDTVDFNDVLGAPQITTDLSSIECAIAPGDSTAQTIVLRNTGDYQLSFAANVTYPTDGTMRVRPRNQLNPITPDPRNPPIPVHGTPAEKEAYAQWVRANTPVMTSPTDNFWNADSAGYVARDNNGGGASYNWEDIATTGTEITNFNGSDDDGWTNSIPIGFTMPFYGQNFDSIYVSANGFLTFRGYGYNCAYYGALPSNYYQIGPFKFDNYHVVGTSHYYYQMLSNPNRMVVQFNNVRYYNSTYRDNAAYSKTFEIVLYQNGLVKIQYQSLGTLAPTSGIPYVAGIDNEGAGGINVFDSTVFVSGLTDYCVEFNLNSFYDYVRVSPSSADVGEGQLLEVGVTMFAADTIAEGTTLAANIVFTSNACTTVTIPVTILVTRTAVAENSKLPLEYKLHQNYPNPFNPSTEIRFDLKKAGLTKLTIYNALGQQVATLVNNYLPAGYHSVRFRGNALATGVYFYRIESGSFTSIKKMVMVK